MKNEYFFNSKVIGEPLNRVDGRLKVTGAAKYAAEYDLPGLVYAVLAGSTITRGSIKSIDTRQAEKAPGVLAVITHLNAPVVPGYGPSKPGRAPVGQGLRLFYNEQVYFNDQPIAMVIADTPERAKHAATLVKAQYNTETYQTDFAANMAHATLTTQAQKDPKSSQADYVRGEADAYKNAPVKIEEAYTLPSEVHNPMELHSVIAVWEGDKLTLYDKTQGVKNTQKALMTAFQLPEEKVQINSRFVGGAFGSALRTWPHVIAAAAAARKVGKPVKLVLGRDQMFTNVGYRPHTWQKVGIGATAAGKITGITHEAIGQSSTYEEFTEGVLQMTRMMYDCDNVTTRYKLLQLDVGTPAPMRGPGESTGAYALECAMDELSYALKMDPIELRLRNYAAIDPERKLPWSSKFLKECYQQGAEHIGWHNRKPEPGTTREGEWLVGYGMGTGVFGAHRGLARAKAILKTDGSLLIQSAASDIGPGTGTAMVQIAAEEMGMPVENITFELGNSSLPQAPTQGGSATVASVGSAVKEVCIMLKQKLQELKAAGQPQPEVLEVMAESKPGDEQKKYSMYSFSVHFAKVHVHPATGEVRVQKVVACIDAGTIINHKTAGSQSLGGIVGAIGMALTEEVMIDHRYGRLVNNNFADYHVPVQADIMEIVPLFVDKPDPYNNPIGTKGIGEIALIGCAPAIANAVYHATGRRVRDLPITPDKLL